MARAHPYRAAIPPVAPGVDRPLWSVMIPTFECASYLPGTLESVLVQDSGPHVMQVEVVDDYSRNDDPGAVVEQIGRGRVGFYRQPENVGHTRNFETCLRRAHGHLIHLLHGDDLVADGFYAALGRAFEERPDIGAAFCRYRAIDEDGRVVATPDVEICTSGVIPDWLLRIGAGQRLQTPCMVVRRDVYERLGGFDDRLRGAEDWEMWVRIAAHYPVWYEPEPLALYRVHTRSKSQRALRTGANVRALRKAIDINREHLPVREVDSITREALRACAGAALRRSERLHKGGDRQGALAQFRAAWGTYPSLAVAIGSARVIVRSVARALLRSFGGTRPVKARSRTSEIQ